MVDVFILTKSNMKRIIAQCDIIFSNSMIESVNKRMKYDFLFRTKLLDYQQVVKYIPTAVEEYNNKPLSALYGLTPNEVLRGMMPDKNMFKENIQQAARNRPAINSAMNCLNCKK
jgi:putative transposase